MPSKVQTIQSVQAVFVLYLKLLYFTLKIAVQ